MTTAMPSQVGIGSATHSVVSQMGPGGDMNSHLSAQGARGQQFKVVPHVNSKGEYINLFYGSFNYWYYWFFCTSFFPGRFPKMRETFLCVFFSLALIFFFKPNK